MTKGNSGNHFYIKLITNKIKTVVKMVVKTFWSTPSPIHLKKEGDLFDEKY